MVAFLKKIFLKFFYLFIFLSKTFQHTFLYILQSTYSTSLSLHMVVIELAVWLLQLYINNHVNTCWQNIMWIDRCFAVIGYVGRIAVSFFFRFLFSFNKLTDFDPGSLKREKRNVLSPIITNNKWKLRRSHPFTILTSVKVLERNTTLTRHNHMCKAHSYTYGILDYIEKLNAETVRSVRVWY